MLPGRYKENLRIRKFPLTCMLLFSYSILYGQFETNIKNEYSNSVGDSFEIYISLPASYKPTSTYNVVYYCDANLNSGKYLQQLLTTNQFDSSLKNVIFVGIGHIGNYHVLRRRDFIFPSTTGKTVNTKKLW